MKCCKGVVSMGTSHGGIGGCAVGTYAYAVLDGLSPPYAIPLIIIDAPILHTAVLNVHADARAVVGDENHLAPTVPMRSELQLPQRGNEVVRERRDVRHCSSSMTCSQPMGGEPGGEMRMFFLDSRRVEEGFSRRRWRRRVRPEDAAVEFWAVCEWKAVEVCGSVEVRAR